MAKKRYYNGGDSMINSSGPAGLPTGVVRKYYPSDGGYMPEGLNDGLSGIDAQIKSDKAIVKRQKPDSKF